MSCIRSLLGNLEVCFFSSKVTNLTRSETWKPKQTSGQKMLHFLQMIRLYQYLLNTYVYYIDIHTGDSGKDTFLDWTQIRPKTARVLNSVVQMWDAHSESFIAITYSNFPWFSTITDIIALNLVQTSYTGTQTQLTYIL